jgi:hypothetical protein
MPFFYHFFFQTQHTLMLVSGSTDDSVFRCTVQRDIDLSTNQIFGLRNEWYFMFALGNVNKGNMFVFLYNYLYPCSMAFRHILITSFC